MPLTIPSNQEKAKPKPQWTGWGMNNNNGVHSTPNNGLEQIMQAEISVKTTARPSTQQHPQQNQSGVVKSSKKSVWKSLDVHGTSPVKSNAHLTVLIF